MQRPYCQPQCTSTSSTKDLSNKQPMENLLDDAFNSHFVSYIHLYNEHAFSTLALALCAF